MDIQVGAYPSDVCRRCESTQSGTYVSTVVFICWILSVTMTQGQNTQCSETHQIKGDGTDVLTYRFKGPWTYTWCISTTPNYELTFNCVEVNISKINGRCRDTLTASVTGTNQGGRTYCDPFQVIGPSVTLKLTSNDGGGNFRCRVKSERANTCKCGYKGRTGRKKIVNGEPSEVHEFTSMAAIVSSQTRGLHCGAIIIHTYLALTAAHCVVDSKLAVLDPSIYGLLVGAHRFSDVGSSDSVALYRLRRFVPNRNFKNQELDDIAIVETINPMWFDINVGPACLPYKFSDPLYMKTAIVTGWGHTEFGGTESDVLRKGDVVIQYPTECTKHYSTYKSEFMICTLGKSDACQKDSGGPVYYEDPQSGLLFSIGITAAGIGCANGYPSLSTRIYSYLNWIQQQYPEASYCIIR